jgi:hypothetical protein
VSPGAIVSNPHPKLTIPEKIGREGSRECEG